uniref:Uncharacterized protein n=1 Tax=Meloidogyne incognita TaxID=6306 RepID=A0A914KT98_MELIC
MACNPCCCLSLKDAVVTIGIWSTIYALAQLAIFGWQFSVLTQCQHVVMAQSNLQCEYYCPCVGASTARTSAIIEAAIKYEKDRAANTLLPNYNSYGRYDIPTYYESYWQSPEERYYTWLFIIQILCLIAAFFLLFTSIMMIYGVHTWSRFLLVPWMVTMCASILTSLAYCIMWWAGDVRDYWLMLTIIEMFGVFLNIYCFVVVVAFHQRMQAELEYYARRRKYNRFYRGREIPQQIDQDFVDSDKRTDLPQVQQGQRRFGGIQRPPASQFPAVSPPGQPPLRHKSIPPPHTIPVPPLPSTEQIIPQQLPKQPFYKQKTPMERFVQEASAPPPQYRESFSPPFDVPRSRSAIDRPFNRHADEFYRETPNRFRRANSSHRYRLTCRNCGREHGRRYNYRYQCRRCYPDISTRMRHRKNSSSSLCSLATHHEITDNLDDNRSDRNLTQNRLRHRPPMPLPPQTHWSDHESDYWSGIVPPMANSEHNYTNLNSKERTQSLAPPILPRRRKRNESAMEGISSQTRPSQKTLEVPQGISIPQHIIIPPMTNDGTLDSQTERQYRINSEIVISYDQPSRQNISSQTFQSPPSGKQLKNTEISNQQKLPIPLERRSLKSSISPKQLPMALTSTV